MSGVFCPYCSGGEIKQVNGKDQCQMCGWTGKLDLGFRAWLTNETIDSLARDEALKKAGKLFYIRVYYKEGADISFEMIDILKVNGCASSSSDNLPCEITRMDKKPTVAMLKKLRNLPGVLRVEVW